MSSNTTQRGYGWSHQQERARVKAAMQANGGALCWRCHEWISPDEGWDLGHSDTDRSVYKGPEHARCNRGTAAHHTAAPERLPVALRMLNFNVDGCIYIEALGGHAEESDGTAIWTMRDAEGLTFVDSDGNELTPTPGPLPKSEPKHAAAQRE